MSSPNKSFKNNLRVRSITYSVSGIVSVIISASFFFISKVIVGLIEFVASLFNSRKKELFLQRYCMPIILIINTTLFFADSKKVGFVSQISANVQIILLFANICLMGILFKCAEIALSVPKSTNQIFEDLGELTPYKWFTGRLRNPADIIWVKTIGVLTILIIPAFIGILLPSSFNLYTVINYGIICWKGSSAINMLEHINSHHRIFTTQKHQSKRDRRIFKALSIYTEYILNFTFARVPKWYEVQHVFIHHQEDNGENDTQSTLRYDRSSFIDFARCANLFALSGLLSFDVINYLKKNKRSKALKKLLWGMCVFYVSLVLLSFWNWHFAVTILAVRYCSQIVSTLGFFLEHGMIDTGDPQNIYRNSIHFITLTNSHASLGDDAHIEHHLHMGKHWTRYSEDVNNNIESYACHRALGYLDSPEGVRKYYRLIWRRDYSKLAQNFIILGNKQVSNDDIAVLLWERTRPVSYRQRSDILDRFDIFLGRIVGFLLV